MRTAWNEPRHFFFWLTLLSVLAIATISFLDAHTPWLSPPPWMQTCVLVSGICLIAGAVVGLFCFILSWIPPIRRLFAWMLQRRLFVLACLLTLIALFYTEEDLRGKLAWNKCRRELEANGAQLNLKAFIPKPVPDEQNFAATPFVKSCFAKPNYAATERRWHDAYSRASDNIPQKAERDRHFIDLVAWETASDVARSSKANWYHNAIESHKLDLESRAKAAPAVLEMLKTNEAVFAELRAASHRPYSRYPIFYDLENPWGILLPHLSNARNVCKRLQLKACAELAAGQGKQALQDVELILYMADSFKGEPFLISYLVRIACLDLSVQPIWEGLAEHAWSDAQLQELQAHLQQYDFVSDLKLPLDSEQAGGVLTIDLLFKRKYNFGQLTGGNREEMWAADLLFRIIPHGWYHLEQLSYCRLFQTQLGRTFDPMNKRVWPSRVRNGVQVFEQAFSPRNSFNIIVHHRVMSGILLPALGKLPLRAAKAQTEADQAALACALERYRLTNGQFPESLEALAPRFISQLSHDVITGEPYKYHRTTDGQFVLYSVGWNEKEDGGVPGETLFDEKQGDWVWQYPAP